MAIVESLHNPGVGKKGHKATLHERKYMMAKASAAKEATVLEKIRQRMKVVRAESADGGDDFNIPEFIDAFPVLNAYLCEDTQKGTSRKGATVTLWVDDLGLHAVVNDRDAKVKAFFVSHAMNSLWGDLEAFLLSDDPDWRSEAGTKSRGRRRP
jgi:hypothetical protein